MGVIKEKQTTYQFKSKVAREERDSRPVVEMALAHRDIASKSMSGGIGANFLM